MAFLLPALGLCGLASCATSGICTVARVCCCAVGAATGRGHGVQLSSRSAKAGHILIMAVSAILALVLYNYGDQITWLTSIDVIKQICTEQGQATVSQCYGASAALRISLALCIFFSINLLTSFAGEAFVGWWSVKFLLWLGLMIGSFFIPATAIEKYGQTSRVFSTLFLLAMVIILIDFAYHTHELLHSKAAERDAELSGSYDEIGLFQNCWRLLYLAISLSAVLASLIGIGFLYHFSANRPEGVECGSNLGFLSITLISGVIFMIIAPLKCAGERGILPPALIFAYCTWLVWSAIYSNPDVNCTPVPPNKNNTGATIVGMIIAALSLCYTAFSASRSIPHLFDTGKKAATAAAVAEEEAEEAAEAAAATRPIVGGARAGSGDEKGALTASYHAAGADKMERGDAADYGHHHAHSSGSDASTGTGYSVMDSLVFSIVMVLASLYMAQVLTNWVYDPSDVQGSRTDVGAMWVNIASQWATIVLFAWTIVAPMVCTSRDFS